MAKIKNIFVDFDDVLTQTRKAYCEVYNNKYKDNEEFIYADYTKIWKWDLKSMCPLEDDIFSIFNSDELFECLELYPGVYEVLERLSHTYNIVVCSVCSPVSMSKKAIYGNSKLPFISDYILLTENNINKGVVSMSNSAFIDDNALNLDFTNASVKVAFGRENETNTSWKGTRVLEWNDKAESIIRNAIEEYEKISDII